MWTSTDGKSSTTKTWKTAHAKQAVLACVYKLQKNIYINSTFLPTYSSITNSVKWSFINILDYKWEKLELVKEDLYKDKTYKASSFPTRESLKKSWRIFRSNRAQKLFIISFKNLWFSSTTDQCSIWNAGGFLWS